MNFLNLFSESNINKTDEALAAEESGYNAELLSGKHHCQLHVHVGMLFY